MQPTTTGDEKLKALKQAAGKYAAGTAKIKDRAQSMKEKVVGEVAEAVSKS